jgi:RNA polymerase subunit RPABC4/transcription elongation factor Spt4
MRTTCRACGQKVSQASAWCPWCGERVYSQIPWLPILIIAGIILILGVLVLVLALTGNG